MSEKLGGVFSGSTAMDAVPVGRAVVIADDDEPEMTYGELLTQPSELPADDDLTRARLEEPWAGW